MLGLSTSNFRADSKMFRIPIRSFRVGGETMCRREKPKGRAQPAAGDSDRTTTQIRRCSQAAHD